MRVPNDAVPRAGERANGRLAVPASNQQPATSNQQPATRHISHNRAITRMLDPLLVVNSGLVVD
jgi:hypothetical protein